MQKKSGYVAILGRPNSGKSTLLNAILGQELSIVTPKPQTTRNKVFGIYTEDNIQIIFIDTPGILDPKYKLQQFMKKEVDSSFSECDVLLLVIDIEKYNSAEIQKVYSRYQKHFSSIKSICALNKIDKVNKDEVLLTIRDINQKLGFIEIIPVSAIRAYNINELIKTITKYLPDSEFYYDENIITSQPERFFVSEIIREQAMMMFQDEIPFSIYVEIEEFKEHKGKKDFIKANIIVEKDSQKPIVIGQNGMKIRDLGQRSRSKIEHFTGKPIYLELKVKVRKDWKNDEKFLKQNYKALTSPVA
jgi:GTP-binding protein Era